MIDRQDRLREAAVGWAIRLNDEAFDDWDGFAAWLEADPAHALAYEEVLAAGDAADVALRQRPAPSISTPPPAAKPLPWRRQAAGGLAAAVLVGALGWGTMRLLPAPYAIETGPGEQRTVSTGAATIALNGGTRLLLDGHNVHVVTLERGEALFEVRHDPDRPFTVHVGDGEVRDVGTRFDLARDLGATRVAVAEGTVLYNPSAEAVRLDAGQMLATNDGAPALRVAPVSPAEVGGWREGRLSYRQAPLSSVAADLTRGLGVPIVPAPEIAAQPFTGAIVYRGDRARFLAGLGPLLDVTVKHDHERWLLTRKAASRH